MSRQKLLRLVCAWLGTPRTIATAPAPMQPVVAVVNPPARQVRDSFLAFVKTFGRVARLNGSSYAQARDLCLERFPELRERWRAARKQELTERALYDHIATVDAKLVHLWAGQVSERRLRERDLAISLLPSNEPIYADQVLAALHNRGAE